MKSIDDDQMSSAARALSLDLSRNRTAPPQVLEVKVYRGPNPYGYRPVIRFKFDLGVLEDHPTNEIHGFTERLLDALPTLHEHGCSYGRPGGFVQRLREGTWMGHVAEHVAMELQCMAGTRVTYGKTRSTGEKPGVYNVVYSYLDERVGLLAGWLALRLLSSLLPDDLCRILGTEKFLFRDGYRLAEDGVPFHFQSEMEALIKIAQKLALGPTTQSIVDEAKRRGTQNPRLLGIGIDEDTSIVVEDSKFEVVGNGAVYIVDGEGVTYSNVADEESDRTLSMFDVKIHVLSHRDHFCVKTRRPRIEP